MKVLGKIKNGNYLTYILEDGTKIRKNNLDYFEPEKPESLDYKITNKCDMGCRFCHENSTPEGLHGDIMNDKFIETLLPYTELAVGGGNPLEHPDLVPFLKKCKSLNLIPNMTINQKHFLKDQAFIKQLVDEKLIYGLGVSVTSVTPELVELLKQYPNAVIHLINGVHSLNLYKELYDQGFKILILGYKQFRRGETYYSTLVEETKNEIKEALPEILEHFKVVSFDNLALDQLEVKSLLTPEEWETFFMGGDGTFTMFVDSVTKTFCKSSTTPVNERQALLDDIKPMFDYVRSHR